MASGVPCDCIFKSEHQDQIHCLCARIIFLNQFRKLHACFWIYTGKRFFVSFWIMFCKKRRVPFSEFEREDGMRTGVRTGAVRKHRAFTKNLRDGTILQFFWSRLPWDRELSSHHFHILFLTNCVEGFVSIRHSFLYFLHSSPLFFGSFIFFSLCGPCCFYTMSVRHTDNIF